MLQTVTPAVLAARYAAIDRQFLIEAQADLLAEQPLLTDYADRGKLQATLLRAIVIEHKALTRRDVELTAHVGIPFADFPWRVAANRLRSRLNDDERLQCERHISEFVARALFARHAVSADAIRVRAVRYADESLRSCRDLPDRLAAKLGLDED